VVRGVEKGVALTVGYHGACKVLLPAYPCCLVHLTLAFESGLSRHFCSFMRGTGRKGGFFRGARCSIGLVMA